VALSGLVVLAITVLVIVGPRHRYLPVGWFWFLGTLVADRWHRAGGACSPWLTGMAYVSFIGLFLMICWGVADCSEHLHLPAVLLPSVSVAALLALALLARHQINYWQSDEALWTHALQISADNWLAESQLGSALAMEGRVEAAMPHFYKALALSPGDGPPIWALPSTCCREEILRIRLSITSAWWRTRAESPNCNQCLGGNGQGYRALGDKAKSQECMEQARRVPDRQ